MNCLQARASFEILFNTYPSLKVKISEIANVSASSTTKPGKIRDSAKSVPTAETTKSLQDQLNL